MKAKIGIDRLTGRVGGARSESGGCAEQPVGGAPLEIPDVVRDRLADEVIDELLAGAWTEEGIVGPGGVLAQRTKRLVERAMSGADRASRRRAASGAAWRCRQYALRLDGEDARD
ncbi:MAG TPA: hypothetical protein VKO84_04495 [Gaiellaceae bacterium]|nr:hypothetical protein [Gaiellaceae bacterium]